MKYSVVLSNDKYKKFEKAHNKKLDFTCKGFNISLIQSSSDVGLFSITNGISEIYIDIQKIEINFYSDCVMEGKDCIISIININAIDVNLRLYNGNINKLKFKQIFNFRFK